jgi:AraC-like DNA-binding protein
MNLVYAPIALDPDFPIAGGDPFIQGDNPIRALHYHECLELGYCYEGSGIFMIGEKVLPFEAGDVTFIDHTEVHLARSVPGTTSRWCWIYLDPLRLINSPGIPPSLFDFSALSGAGFNNILSPSEDAELGLLVQKMAVELRERPEGYEWCLPSLALEFCTRLRRLPRVAELPSRSAGRHAVMERIAPALQIIARDYARPLHLPELARACNLSEPSLRRLFQEAVGRSPRAYWLDLRLRMAASMLRTTSRGVLQISQDVGFPTLSSFNRLFKTKYGVSPLVWRDGRASSSPRP